MTTRPIRPDTGFVLHVNAFTHKTEGGYRCTVFEGRVTRHGAKLSAARALAYVAAYPDTVLAILHV